MGSEWELAGNLAPPCNHHHFLKTFRGWTLTRTDSRDTGTPDWRFEPDVRGDPSGRSPDWVSTLLVPAPNGAPRIEILDLCRRRNP
jgi:hypothetical protein